MLFTKPQEMSGEAFCFYPFTKLKIDSAGDCSFCCFHTRKCLGNILEYSLEEIWNSDLAKEIRTTTLQNQMHRTCAVDSCPFYHIRNNLQKNFSVRQARVPIDIELDLPMQHCNIGGEDPKPGTACIMCERALDYHRQVDRVDDVCDKLKPYSEKFKSLHIQGVAEAFWKNKLFDVVERIGIKPSGTRITTFTNGTIFSGDKLDKWLNYPWSCLTFSIDAATPETYKKIRIWNAYDRIIANMKEFAKRRSVNQTLQIHNNINMLNIHEVKGMVEVAADVGVDMISFNPTYNLAGLIVDQSNMHLFARAQDEIKETAQRLNVKVEFLRALTLDLVQLC
jgi:MoaA/NifB/PqqE/SkfB family radical SAM enzyme